MKLNFGNKGLIGQKKARSRVEKILASGRLSHAYLISGPAGSGKTAFALAFAEAINGVSHMTDLGDATSSKKSSWFTHPDIHVFIPKPTSADISELKERLNLLSKDAYAIVDFSQRPSLTSDTAKKNLQAFYPIDYFREHIRPVAKLKPNEGKRVVVILTRVETMRKETANAFLKLLEEPYDRLMFILTTENTESLLPTITSRCQHIRLSTLTPAEVEEGLIEVDGISPEDAKYLARVSGGNYSGTRFFDVERIKQTREEIVIYMRKAYMQDAVEIPKIIQDWHSTNNIEGLIAILDLMEMFIRDLIIYSKTKNDALIANIDQLEPIQNFCNILKDAKLDTMLAHLDECRPLLRQNVSPKYIFTALSFRFSNLMRGQEPPIADNEPWKHLPALVLK